MLVLAIETSCDETAASVVLDGRRVLSNVIASQIDVHSRYGGVVPEIASRKHMEAVVPVVMQALDDAGVVLRDIEGIAVTRGRDSWVLFWWGSRSRNPLPTQQTGPLSA